MAGSSGRTADSVVHRLFNEPYRFDFVQAVRVLEAFGRERSRSDGSAARMPVGVDFSPDQEALRFHALPGRSFPTATVNKVQRAGGPQGEDSAVTRVTVSFMGLTGPGGVLPEHYTDLLLQRIRIKDYALRDFLDLFNHRTISLFYRACIKYRHQFSFGRFENDNDAFSMALRCLAGMGGDHIRRHPDVPDETYQYYSGRFAGRLRPANGLEEMLSSYLGVGVSVQQFRGHWLTLADEERTVLSSGPERSGYYNRLGMDTILGEKVWDVQSRFRLRVGPLDNEAFDALLPCGEALKELCSITRAYVGPEFDFDVQLVLRGEQVGHCRLRGKDSEGAALGWNSWLGGSHDSVVDNACFRPKVHTSKTSNGHVSSTTPNTVHEPQTPSK